MKKLTLSFWLALALASIFAIQATPALHHTNGVIPMPTCPPSCPAK